MINGKISAVHKMPRRSKVRRGSRFERGSRRSKRGTRSKGRSRRGSRRYRGDEESAREPVTYRSSSAGEPVASNVQKLRHLSQNAFIRHIILNTTYTAWGVKQKLKDTALSDARMDGMNKSITDVIHTRIWKILDFCERLRVKRAELETCTEIIFGPHANNMSDNSIAIRGQCPLNDMVAIASAIKSGLLERLEVIEIREGLFGDEGIRHFCLAFEHGVRLTNLRKLNFTQCGLTNVSVERLRNLCFTQDALPSLEILDLAGNRNAPDAWKLLNEFDRRIEATHTANAVLGDVQRA